MFTILHKLKRKSFFLSDMKPSRDANDTRWMTAEHKLAITFATLASTFDDFVFAVVELRTCSTEINCNAIILTRNVRHFTSTNVHFKSDCNCENRGNQSFSNFQSTSSFFRFFLMLHAIVKFWMRESNVPVKVVPGLESSEMLR